VPHPGDPVADLSAAAVHDYPDLAAGGTGQDRGRPHRLRAQGPGEPATDTGVRRAAVAGDDRCASRPGLAALAWPPRTTVSQQMTGVEPQMLFHEGGDVVVAVIVARAKAIFQGIPGTLRRLDQQLRLQLLG